MHLTCLHVGPLGFDMRVFNVENLSKSSVTLSYISVDGESNFPGICITFILIFYIFMYMYVTGTYRIVISFLLIMLSFY